MMHETLTFDDHLAIWDIPPLAWAKAQQAAVAKAT